MSEDAAGACCGLCCVGAFSALASWCNLNPYGIRGNGGSSTGCCGSCCSKSFNEDSMDKWDKDRAALRVEKSQPTASEPMKISTPATDPNLPPSVDSETTTHDR
ncbi:hypothetical protein C8J57DRAFT_1271842 [Mycena rebaudengoi]|nr:hypothetical protein C8J57DRAFT_1271842 [Mycena rebaudengoi]